MGPRVMIVDDDDVNNFLCKKIISLARFSENIQTFIDADSALKYLKSNMNASGELPDIIFLDINMPIKNGWDFLKEYEKIKEDLAKPIQIYMLSSSVYEEDVTRAKSMDVIVDYISKPLSESVLQKIAI